MAKITKKSTPKTGAADKPPAAKKTAGGKATTKKSTAKKEGTTLRKTTKKATAKKAAIKKASARSDATAGNPKVPSRRIVTAADRLQMIAEAAYLRGESQGFLSDEREDWLLAEAEVDARLRKSKIEVLG